MSTARKPYKCPEQDCAAALTTKSNLKRHMSKHRPKVRMPCGKAVRDHSCNNVRHQKSCGKCQSVHAAEVRNSDTVHEAGGNTGNTHTHPAGTPSDGSAFSDQQRILQPAMTEPHTTPGYATSSSSELQCFAAIDPMAQVYEHSPTNWLTDPGAWTGDGYAYSPTNNPGHH
ncbi:hypothetical protein LX32DRAFT_699415 [Colletotrichum zoysiae]|uniref:C2H2-type domain-containing protein n=1 Tax=Colletotrichum zoysiae TaxID=1216348 RepID=A0AAD9H3Z8_9PEZI|nr:hypothetical protein LX32DRAFT_699415 [Colletotrichum zoysiae]